MSSKVTPAGSMVETQLISRGIRDRKVIDAFLKVPRRAFVPPQYADEAYDDHPLPIGDGQTISQPFMAAVMTELLDIGKTDKVLEIGTGSGYQTAILAELGKEIFTVERIRALSENAKAVLGSLHYANIRFKTGDGTLGWPEEAPFDKIIVTAAAREIPGELAEQLAEGGKLVIPVGERFSQVLVLAEKKNGSIKIGRFGGCVFVPLVGKHSTEQL